MHGKVYKSAGNNSVFAVNDFVLLFKKKYSVKSAENQVMVRN